MSQRMTALMDRPFVVFLIGMRINKWWRPDLWLPVAMSMPKMVWGGAGAMPAGE